MAVFLGTPDFSKGPASYEGPGSKQQKAIR